MNRRAFGGLVAGAISALVAPLAWFRTPEPQGPVCVVCGEPATRWVFEVIELTFGDPHLERDTGRWSLLATYKTKGIGLMCDKHSAEKEATSQWIRGMTLPVEDTRRRWM